MRLLPGGLWLAAMLAVIIVTPLHGGAVVVKATASSCGNGVVETGEECDDGGICIGGPHAGLQCTDPSTCGGGGVCVNGPRDGVACSNNLNCPFGSCVQCKTFGGDGCASNCTFENDVPTNFVPGVTQGTVLAPGTSGIVVHSGVFSLAIPITGYHTLSIGKERDGKIPLAVKASSVRYPRISVSGIVCGCSRGTAAKTCGGTLWDADGVKLTPDCTEGFTAGDIVCAGRYPCAFLNGPGNSSAGVVGCGGIDAQNIQVTQDCVAASGVAAASPIVSISGAGGPGAALMVNSTAITAVIGACSGTDPAMGPDQEFCTDDDDLAGSPSFRFSLPATTGTANGLLFNTSNFAGLTLGPFSGTGMPFTCNALSQGWADGASMVGALTVCDQNPLGDLGARSQLVIGLPLATATPTPTGPTPTPTPPPPFIRGDAQNPSGKRSGCQLAWKVFQSSVVSDRYGLAATHQICEDADPSCDFALQAPGLCEFLVQACLNVEDPDLKDCVPSGVASVEVLMPNTNQSRYPAVKETLSADRFALTDALEHLMDPTRPGNGFIYKPPLTAAQRNLCSAPFPVQILTGARPKASVTLKVRSKDFTAPRGKREISRLRLTCKSRLLRSDPQ